MNLAEMLIKSALQAPDRPAVALGEKVLFDYRTLERRVARLAGGLRRSARPRGRRPRRARDEERARICRGDVRVLARRARRGAGQCQAPSARDRLYPREQRRARLLGNRGAGGRRGLAPAAAGGTRAHHRGGKCRLCRPSRRRGPAARRVLWRRDRLALLYERHHGPAQGRHAQPSQPGDRSTLLFRRRRRHRTRRRHHPRSPHVARLGPLRGAARRQGRLQHRARERGLRRGRDLPPGQRASRRHHVLRPHHGAPPARPSGAQGGRSRPAQDHRLRRCSDVSRRPQGSACHPRQPARANLRPGREPHDHHLPHARGIMPKAAIRATSSTSPRRVRPIRAWKCVLPTRKTGRLPWARRARCSCAGTA